MELGSSNTDSPEGIELVYVGFWRRLAAYLVDIAILMPYGLLTSRFAYTSKEGFIISQAVAFIIGIIFEIYLVKRFGGSPGKLLMNMRIAKVDGSPAGYREASIRYSVLFGISLLSSGVLVLSALKMPDSEYGALTYKTRILRLREMAPAHAPAGSSLERRQACAT